MAESEKETENLKPLFYLLTVVFVVWALSYVVVRMKYSLLPERALFGDAFGGINALFSGLAFAGVIFTIHLQRKELALQREELKQTREELKRSAEAQEKSEAALRLQAENFNKSAKLAALNTLVNFYSEELTHAVNRAASLREKNVLAQKSG